MSGGVDSSVTAAILQDRGFRAEGITMRLWREAPCENEGPTDAIVSARTVCEHLGIRHHTVDLADKFHALVVKTFVDEYALGRTPNPCIRCNRFLKFGLLFDQLVPWDSTFLPPGTMREWCNRTSSLAYSAELIGARTSPTFSTCSVRGI